MRRPFYTVVQGVLLGSLLAAHVQAQSRDERDVRALLDRAFQAANSVDDKLSQQNLTEHSRSGGPFFPPFVAGRPPSLKSRRR